MSESHKETLIRRAKTTEQLDREKQEVSEKGQAPTEKRLKFSLSAMFTRPLMMLGAQPAHLLSSVYLAYTFAVVLALPVILPDTFSNIYGFNYEKQGLTFAGMCAGLVIAFGIIMLNDKFVHQPRVKSWDDEHDPLNEKGTVEMTDGHDGPQHSSWRKGLAVSTRNLGLDSRSSKTDSTATPRSNSNSSTGTRNSTTSSNGTNRRHSKESKSSRRSRLQAFSEKNINIAIAATRFLNAVPANANRKIIVERVMVLLKDTESFTEICESLEKLGLEFEEALLAKVVVDALEKEKKSDDIPLSRSKSLHRQAAQAALMGSSEAEDTVTPLDSPIEEPKMSKLEAPPAEWRFLPALPATLLFPASLIMLGFTTKASVSWIIPVVGMALFGLSTSLIYFSATAFTLELHDDAEHASSASAGSMMLTFLLSAVFPLFVKPMYTALGFQWATCVFGFVGVALGVVPWILVLGGRKMIRGRQTAA